MVDEVRAKIERNIQIAEENAGIWREVLAAYDKAIQSSLEFEMVRQHPSDRAIDIATKQNQRQRVGPDIRVAIDRLPTGQEFTLQDVFNNFPTKGLDYEKSRPSISIWLSDLEKEGVLRKVKRGLYIKLKSL